MKNDQDPSLNGGNTLYFVLGAVLIKARSLEKIEKDVEKIKQKYFKSQFQEVKYSLKNGVFKKDLGSPSLIINQYRNEAFSCISRSDLTLFEVGQNKYECKQKGLIQSKDDTYYLSFQHLVSIINSHMHRYRIKDPVTVFINSIDDPHDEKMYKSYKKALENESLFPNFDKTIFSPSLNFAKSKFTIGLQLADLVAGSLWRALEGKDKTYSTIIKKKFPSSHDGNPMKYGYVNCSEWLI
ncbi:DUF3800 domain-containing protein [Paenactinomyces guangxiensis]|uniref:DUF3800 domain-containing protein n=2 Tax=Paenactinomyces guangxiensis TaxID=1490290 RepID=A0A7W2A7S3_9BACL|nr:DUF3800 domain-containing protein [Paenactinomyces guangxiensis]MBH8590520.1 DUF3800 domain-containing protein [Paenactinomyces guangxiensis]